MNMDMNIRNSAPRQIVCISNKDGTWGGNDQASKFLVVGNVYHLADIDIHDFHTRVFLEEFPDHWFNSVAFAEIDAATPSAGTTPD